MNHLSQCDPQKVLWRGCVWFDEAKKKVMVNALNGIITINLKSGTVELGEADPWSFATERFPVSYDPAAKCHMFDYLLTSALPDAADQNLLQCFAGYCLLPDYRFQCVLFAHGRPNSGKSLLIYHGLGSVFGDRLMSKVSLEKICSGGDELRHLEHSLMNIGTEIEEHHLEDSNIFNQLTSGESIDAALKYERSRTIKPSCKHIFIGNHPPRWKRGSHAQTRRIAMIHFPNNFSKEAKDGRLENEVKQEGSGILNWMIAGLLKVAALTAIPLGSETSRAHYEHFKLHNNPVETFNAKYCIFGREYRLPSADYHKAIAVWAKSEGVTFSDRTDFTKLLKESRADEIITPSSSLRHEGIKRRMILGVCLNQEGQNLLTERLWNTL